MLVRATAGRKCCYPRIAKGRFPRTAKRPGKPHGSNFLFAFLGQQSAANPGERPMPPRCVRGPRPQGPLFWDRKPLLSPYRASRAGRSAHRTLAPSPSCAAQRIQDSGPRGRNFPQKSDKRNASGASHWHFHQLLFSNGDVEIAHFKNNQTQRKQGRYPRIADKQTSRQAEKQTSRADKHKQTSTSRQAQADKHKRQARADKQTSTQAHKQTSRQAHINSPS